MVLGGKKEEARSNCPQFSVCFFVCLKKENKTPDGITENYSSTGIGGSRSFHWIPSKHLLNYIWEKNKVLKKKKACVASEPFLGKMTLKTTKICFCFFFLFYLKQGQLRVRIWELKGAQTEQHTWGSWQSIPKGWDKSKDTKYKNCCPLPSVE